MQSEIPWFQGDSITFQATDRDSGPNGEISFKLMNSSAKRFSFDEKTGELNTTGPFDYESSIKWFYLIFTVFDHGSKQRNATQILEVAVQVQQTSFVIEFFIDINMRPCSLKM